jgi:hypothetical protein
MENRAFFCVKRRPEPAPLKVPAGVAEVGSLAVEILRRVLATVISLTKI